MFHSGEALGAAIGCHCVPQSGSSKIRDEGRGRFHSVKGRGYAIAVTARAAVQEGCNCAENGVPDDCPVLKGLAFENAVQTNVMQTVHSAGRRCRCFILLNVRRIGKGRRGPTMGVWCRKIYLFVCMAFW